VTLHVTYEDSQRESTANDDGDSQTESTANDDGESQTEGPGNGADGGGRIWATSAACVTMLVLVINIAFR